MIDPSFEGESTPPCSSDNDNSPTTLKITKQGNLTTYTPLNNKQQKLISIPTTTTVYNQVTGIITFKDTVSEEILFVMGEATFEITGDLTPKSVGGQQWVASERGVRDASKRGVEMRAMGSRCEREGSRWRAGTMRVGRADVERVLLRVSRADVERVLLRG